MSQVEYKNGWTKIPPWVTLTIFIGTQIILVVVFVTRLDSRLAYVDVTLTRQATATAAVANDLRALADRIDRMETPLAQRVEGLVQAVDKLNTTVITDTARLEAMRRDVDRLDARAELIAKNIEYIYNLLNQIKRKNGADDDIPPQRREK